jgi:hypothetical protein
MRSGFASTSLLIFILAILQPVLFAQAVDRINGHRIVLDTEGKLLAWINPQVLAYDHVMRLGWTFLQSKVPIESNGLRSYLTHSTFDPATLHGTDWPHDPAGLYAMFVDSALSFYAYSGDAVMLERVREMLDYQLAHGTTPSNWEWANIPYASSDPDALEYVGADDTYFCKKEDKISIPCGRGDGHYVVEPDKIGELGLGYLRFYELAGDDKYRDAALACAKALATHAQSGDLLHSPWPFRVFAHTGVVREAYTANLIAAIKLFDELMRIGLGSSSAYQRARQMAWDWLMTYPMKNNLWNAYFEDVPIDKNLDNWNQYIAAETARYLMENPDKDAEWKGHVSGLIAWIEKNFAVDVKATEQYRLVQQETIQYGKQWGANVISEQSREDMDKMGSHTARYASLCALWYEKSGDVLFKDKAFRSFNWATYMAQEDGRITEAMAESEFWYSDGYADYMRHFLAGMGSIPEWAPPKEDHLLRSSSVVQKINYVPEEVHYSTFDPAATEVLRLSFTPAQITVDGTLLPRQKETAGPGWAFDTTLGVLRIRHQKARNIVIRGH